MQPGRDVACYGKNSVRTEAADGLTWYPFGKCLAGSQERLLFQVGVTSNHLLHADAKVIHQL